MISAPSLTMGKFEYLELTDREQSEVRSASPRQLIQGVNFYASRNETFDRSGSRQLG